MKHIVWDFNGTLLCDAQLAVDADNAVFAQLGLPAITVEDYRAHMTMPVRDFYAALGVDYAVHPYETISRLWLDIFNAGALDAGLVPGALCAVRTLHAAGYAQSILSASYEPSLRAQCGALGLTPYMIAIDGLEDESAARKTAIARRQLSRLGLDGKDVVLVGDMLADAELARELGADCILVPWGHNDLPRLMGSGFPVAHSFDELLRLLMPSEEGRNAP